MLQSYHAGFNYCNRNATTDVSTLQLFGGYIGAVSSAIAVAYKLRTTIAKSKRYPPPPTIMSLRAMLHRVHLFRIA